jgi:hypothetical protein
MQQGMDQLSDALGQQRALRDDTQQQQQQERNGQNSQQNQQPSQQGQQQNQQQQQQQQQSAQAGGGGSQHGGQGGDDLADRQSQIRQGLSAAQHAAHQAGATPSPDLDAAGQAMQRSEQALRTGNLGEASSAQDTALDRLRDGAAQLSSQMRAGGEQSGQSQQPQQGQGAADPLGRAPESAQGDGNSGSQMRIGNTSGGADSDRVRAILNEVRRRAEDPNRPQAEREYLRRLLDQFNGN